MAAATEPRFDVDTTQLPQSVLHDLPLANADTDFFANTLVQVNGDGTAENVSHTTGDDDSGLAILANLERQSDKTEEAFTGKMQYDRAGTDPLVELVSGAIIEFEIDDPVADFSFKDTVYAVDNQTVSANAGDGSGGTLAEAGRVYQVRESTVRVLVPGILG